MSSLIHELFRSVLLNFHIYGDFPDFFLLLISDPIQQCPEKKPGIISILLNFLKLLL